MATNSEAYLDTFALIAFLDRSDTYHPLFRQLFSDPSKLITTTLIVAEGHAWFLRRYDRTKALQFLAMIESIRPLKVVGFGPKEQNASSEILRQLSDQDLTATDAAGLHLMSLFRIQSCWSIDIHLSLTGVFLVIHEH